ncbi:hypothetical protein [Pseudomonas fluorescens]|uniref:Uncharacterized protein n=1 Tax=Pseudomonas fluorescens TaxID=294 RepID=A0A5E7NC43_PSEFL|nr:hypothetical protein [Pseudomonas fluorescens]VVP34097.1 hypothetical protein PS880_04491 [Pseudomonas fluorescens]
MIGVPMPHPRDSIIEDLNQKLEQFFGAGKTVQEIASGVSAEVLIFTTTHSNKLRAERDKIAPRLKELADAGTPVAKAAKGCGMEAKRARLIARENGFKFTS